MNQVDEAKSTLDCKHQRMRMSICVSRMRRSFGYSGSRPRKGPFWHLQPYLAIYTPCTLLKYRQRSSMRTSPLEHRANMYVRPDFARLVEFEVQSSTSTKVRVLQQSTNSKSSNLCSMLNKDLRSDDETSNVVGGIIRSYYPRISPETS